MTDTSVVFNVIGRDSGVSSTLGKVKGLFKSTGAEGALAMKVVDHEVEKLDHDIKSAKDSLQVLAREFAKAATASERLALSKQMKRESSNLSTLTKARNLLPKPEELVKEGAEAGGFLSRGIGKAIAENPYMTAGISAAVIAGAPFIGAVIAGAVVGAAGAGGIVGGIAIAKNDARVKSAWTDFAGNAKSVLQNAAAPFVPAVVKAVDLAGDEFDKLTPTIRSVFTDSARYLEPLTRGVMGFIDRMAPGFAKAVAAASPIFTMLQNKLPEIGEEIGNLFDSLSDNANGGAQALGTVINVLDSSLGALTFSINALAEGWDFLDRIGGLNFLKLIGVVDQVPPSMNAAQVAAKGFNEQTKATEAAAKAATDKIDGLIKAMDEFADTNISVYDAETNARSAIDEATKSLKKNGETHSLASSKGRANRDTIVSLANSFNTVTTANDKANTSAKQASSTYDRQRASFIRAAEAAHYTSAQANDLADKMLKLPKNKIINISSNAAAAKHNIDTVAAALNRIPRNVRIAMSVTGNKSVSASAAALRKQEARAGGGPVQRDQPYLVGEEGPELIVPQTDGTVLTASMTRGVMGGIQPGGRTVGSASPSMGAGARQRVELTVNGPRAVAELIRYLVRTVDVVNTAA